MRGCSGQILTLVKITTRVRTPGGFASLPVGASSLTSLTWGEEESLEHMGPRRKLRSRSNPHLIRHHSSEFITQAELHYSPGRQQSVQGFPISIKTLPGATQDSDTKILRSSLLLCYLQLDSTIPMIYGSSYAARSSPHSKCYKTSISMWALMNSGRYLCMAIPTIKRRELGSYKEIITCESYSHVDPHPRRQLSEYKYFSFSIKKRVCF